MKKSKKPKRTGYQVLYGQSPAKSLQEKQLFFSLSGTQGKEYALVARYLLDPTQKLVFFLTCSPREHTQSSG